MILGTVTGVRKPASGTFSTGKLRPFHVSGNLYVVGESSALPDRLTVSKSTNGGVNWTEQDTLIRPSISGGIGSVSSVLVGTTLHVATISRRAASGMDFVWDVRYHTFSTTTDSWSITNEAVVAVVSDEGDGQGIPNVDIVVRANGEVVIGHTGPASTSMGSSFHGAAASVRSTGGTWTTNIQISGTLLEANDISMVVGTSDSVHFIWYHSDALGGLADIEAATLDSSNSVSTVVKLDDGASATRDSMSTLVLWTDTATRIVVAYVVNTNLVAVRADEDINGDISVDLTPEVVATGVDSNEQVGLALDTTNTDVYLFWVDSTSNDLHYNVGPDGVFGATQDLNTDTNLDVWANFYDRSGDKIGYVVDQSGTLRYGEIDLGGGGQTIAVGTLSETDALISAGAVKPIISPIGVLTESESLVNASPVTITLVGTLVESDALVTAEVDKPIVANVGPISGVDILHSVQALKPIIEPVGVLASIDTLIDTSFGKVVEVGALAEFGILVDVQSLKVVDIGLLVEADSLVGVQAVKPIITVIGLIAEDEIAEPVQALKPIITSVGALAELDDLLVVSGRKAVGVDALTEVDSLIDASVVGQLIVAVSTLATDDALVDVQALKPIITSVGALAELDDLLVVSGRKAVGVDALIEVASLISVGVQIGGDQNIPVTSLAETQSLLAVQAVKPLIQQVGSIIEIDSPLGLSILKRAPVGVLTEINALLQVEGLKPIVRAVGVVAEIDALIQAMGVKGVDIGSLTEVNALFDVSGLKAVDVGSLSEIESLFDIGADKPVIRSVGTIGEDEVLQVIIPILGEPVILYMRVTAKARATSVTSKENRTNVESREYDATQEATVEGSV